MSIKLINFIKSLLPRIGKDQILEDLRITATELDQIVIPSYEQAAEFFKVNKPKSEMAKSLSEDFYRKFEKGAMAKQASIIGEVAARLSFIKQNLAYVQAQIEIVLERDILNEGLTAKKAILVRAANQISFISRFSSDVLNYVYVAEAIAVNVDVQESMSLSPAAYKHVQNNIKVFATLLSDYGIPTREFEKIYTAVPDIVVSSRNESSIVGLFKEQDIDPFTSPYVQGFTGNPIYHVRLVFAEWQASRYKANKEKKRMLELRLLHLKLINEKKNDPKIEAEINYIQNRIDSTERYMREVEEDVELA
jgi:hypothetical protein